MSAAYAELQITTNYSFLRGASHVEELVLQAQAVRLEAIGVTDRNSVAGMVRDHQRTREVGIRLVPGCHLDLRCSTAALAYPTDRAAWSALCRLLTLGRPAPASRAATSAGTTWSPMARACSSSFGPTSRMRRWPPV